MSMTLSRNRVVKPILLLGLVIAGAVWLYTGYRPSWFLTHWTSIDRVPFKVDATLEVASRWYPFKRGSLSLLFGPSGLHIMAKGRLGFPHRMRENIHPFSSFSAPATVIFDWEAVKGGLYFHEIVTKAAIVEYGSIDTVVTAPLSRSNKATVVDWLHRGAPRGVSVLVAESEISDLRIKIDESTVSDFVRACRL